MTSDPVLLATSTLHASARGALALERWATATGEVERPVLHHPGAVAVLAQPDRDHLLLVRQWRFALRRWTLEIPAGTRTPGEAPETTARRELEEEAGLRAEVMTEVLRFWPAPGISDEELIIYRADGLSDVPARPEPGELVSREIVNLGGLPGLMRDGSIRDAKTLLAISLLADPGTLSPSPARRAGPGTPSRSSARRSRRPS